MFVRWVKECGVLLEKKVILNSQEVCPSLSMMLKEEEEEEAPETTRTKPDEGQEALKIFSALLTLQVDRERLRTCWVGQFSPGSSHVCAFSFSHRIHGLIVLRCWSSGCIRKSIWRKTATKTLVHLRWGTV